MQVLHSDYIANNKNDFKNYTVVDLFRIAAKKYSVKKAVVADGVSLTFEELEKMSNQIARKISRFDVRKNEIVSMQLGRNVETIAAILGIWKAGCGFTYYSETLPEKNKRSIEIECNIRIHINKTFIEDAIYNESEDFFENFSDLDKTAEIVYTSGSTGSPKGVVITHKNLHASVMNFDFLDFRTTDNFATFASFSFIAALHDISCCLTIGMTLFLVPDNIRKSINEIAEYYIDNSITVTFLPPIMARKYQQIDNGSPLRILLSGSEPVHKMYKRPYRIFNLYASSESCACVCKYEIVDERDTYPIGKIVPEVKYDIVDEDGKSVRNNEIGELLLSGPQIFKEYCCRPELNEKVFFINENEADPEYRRVFRTGDLACRLDDGNLECHGRKDGMVKIRGYRVEITAVDKYLTSFPGIKEACCIAPLDPGGTRILIGYYSSDDEINHEEYRKYLADNMNYYMVPTALIRLDSLPRTLTGKVDRKNLPIPEEFNNHKLLAKKYY